MNKSFSLHKNSNLLLFTITAVFIALSIIISVGPAIWVQKNSEPLPGMQPMTTLERDGLKVYISEGCVACHTQQVRPIESDAVWGRPAVPGDYAYVTGLGPFAPNAPAVLGSERTGPDLTNIGVRQPSDVWQYMHLYNPRSVVSDSVMPAYPWLFDVVATVPEGETAVPVPAEFAPKDGSVVPKERAKALLAYLLYLKQVPLDGSASAERAADVLAQAGGTR